MEIIELVSECKLVRTGSEDNGHDCWGNYETSSYKYVLINGKQERCWDDWYVVHDGKGKVIELTTKHGIKHRNFMKDLDERMKKHLEETGFETPREYAAYLKGKNERT